MAYRLTKGNKTVERNVSVKGSVLNCYDTIGDPDFDMSRDFVLHNRSALEFVRDQLSAEQQADLTEIDIFWRAHAAEFNADFATVHHQEDKQTALTGFVEDENGNTPAIPASHWWWRPIEEKEE